MKKIGSKKSRDTVPLKGVCSLILLSLFATVAASDVDTGGNLPPVSTTLAKMV
jgi:hypothetical protein